MTAAELAFSVAGPLTLPGALRLRDAVYTRDLGHVPQDEMEAFATYLVAIARTEQVVACVRFLGPEARPFDLESSVDLVDLLGRESRPALVGRLCVDPGNRQISKSMRIHTGLMDLTLQYASQRGVTDLLLYTYDNLLRFYRGARFTDTRIQFTHRDWGNVRLMRRLLVDPRSTSAGSKAVPR